MEIKPSTISKVHLCAHCSRAPVYLSTCHRQINTVLQLGLVALGLSHAALDVPSALAIQYLGYAVIGTTVWSGFGYLFAGRRQHLKQMQNKEKQ